MDLHQGSTSEIPRRVVKWGKLQKTGVIIEESEDWKESVFYTEYKQANDIINNILQYSQELKKDDIYNVIPFIGERGTGKTSTMLTVRKMLENYNKTTRNPSRILDFRDIGMNISDGVAFIALEHIDAKILKGTDDIVAIILARMLNYLMKHFEENQTRGAEEKLRTLYQRFEKIFKNLLNLNAPVKLTEGESALRKLRDLSSSYTIREDLKGLIEEYLQYLEEGTHKNYYLVVAIDDIDLYQPDVIDRDTYTLLERIDQFLKIPGVIILTTFCESQLKIHCENHLRKKFDPYSNGKTQDSSLQEIIQNIYLQFLMKIFPSNQRIYMPDFTLADYQRNEQLYISLDSNYPLYAKTDNNGHIDAKKLALCFLAQKTDVYFDAKGEKVHFFEFRKLRDLNDFIHVLNLLKENDKADNREWNYMKLLSYMYNQFANDRLGPRESRQLLKLEEVSIARRSRDLVEYIRIRRNLLDVNSIYHHNLSLTSRWKYSYGELLYNLYCASRADIFSKKMIHCILGSYSFVLTRDYFNWRDRNDIQARIELEQVIGTSIAGRWANNILPRVKDPSKDATEVVPQPQESQRNAIIDYVWTNSSQPLTSSIGSVNILDMGGVFQIPVSDNLLEAFQELFGIVKRQNSSTRSLKKESRTTITEFVNRLEIIGMFFTNGYCTLPPICRFEFKIEEDLQTKLKYLKIENGITACFNILNFVVNSFVWKEYFLKLHEKLSVAIANVILKGESVEQGMFDQFKHKVQAVIGKSSLRKNYEDWDKKYGSLAVPIYNFDMTYNIIKRQADGMTYDMPESIGGDEVLEYCGKIYSNIQSALKDQDEYYGIDTEDTKSFARVFSECPFVQRFDRQANNAISALCDADLQAWFVQLVEQLWLRSYSQLQSNVKAPRN